MELPALAVDHPLCVSAEASGSQASVAHDESGTVSFRAEVPQVLLASMQDFIEAHPNWDQYRLFQAALAGFLVQNGLNNRGVTRCYLANLFPSQASFRG